MTNLVTYLLTHHTMPVLVAHHHAHQLYQLMHAYCTAHHQLTADADYHGTHVIYCYSGR